MMGKTVSVGGEPGNVPPEVKPVDLDTLMQNITHQYEGNTVVYSHQGERAFIDHGNHITIASSAASQNATMILAALLVAKQHYYGKIELTGSHEFKQRAINLIAQHNLALVLKNPQQQMMLDEARKNPDHREEAAPVTAPVDAIKATVTQPPAQSQASPTGVDNTSPTMASAQPVPPRQPPQPAESVFDGVLTGKLLEQGAARR